MKVIREIIEASSYIPVSGNQRYLYDLLSDPSLDREAIADRFDKSSAQFRNTYKNLKDNLLDGLLQQSCSDLSKIKQIHISIRKKSLEAFILLQGGNKRAGLVIAEEVVRMAERYGIIPIVVEMSRTLSTIYATTAHVKYLKYKEKFKKFHRLLNEELLAQQVLDELTYLIEKNKEWKEILPAAKSLKLLLPNNKEIRFRLYYYGIYNYIYSLQEDITSLKNICEEAILFFSSLKVPLPHTTKWLFQMDIVILFIIKGQYSQAEKVIKEALLLPAVGSRNWHTTQQYIAILGLYSDKPAIAQTAMKRAQTVSRKVETPQIKAKWKVIHAYLALYEKTGKITGLPTFRLYRLLNDVSALNKSVTKRNIFILELLHLLARDKHYEYLQRTDGIEQYLSRNAKGKEDNRLRYFLRMLKCIGTGAFHTIRVEAHAKKNKTKLSNALLTYDFNILEKELVPYELLWELALSFLKK